jgi:hypothetical protein
MDYLLILYILFSLAVGAGGTYYLIEGDRTLAGFLYFIGSALILTFYGLRWFSTDALNVSRFNTKSWPPVVNACPDFLTYYERTTNGRKEALCVDMIGVAEGGIQKLTDAANVFNDNFVFKLHMDKTGADRIRALCQECRLKKVTWEGVYDGVSCTATGAVPNADGSNDSAGGEKCD